MGHNYRDLIAWKQANENAIYVYEFTRRFPDKEKFGLTAQLQRAAISGFRYRRGAGATHKGENSDISLGYLVAPCWKCPPN